MAAGFTHATCRGLDMWWQGELHMTDQRQQHKGWPRAGACTPWWHSWWWWWGGRRGAVTTGWFRSQLGGGGEQVQPLHMDCLIPFSHPDGEESGCAMQYLVRPVVKLGERRHMAVATDQNAVRSASGMDSGAC